MMDLPRAARTYELKFFWPDDIHRELAAYKFSEPPWVPRIGEFVHFADAYPPNRPYDHNVYRGRVFEVVTQWFGTTTIIEVYLKP